MNPYELALLPLNCIDWLAHFTLIGHANAALARYDGMLESTVRGLCARHPTWQG